MTDHRRIWGGNMHDYCRAIVVDSFNNIYLVGDTLSFGEGSYDIFLLKFENRSSYVLITFTILTNF